jgi:hypothetical protein
MWAQAGLTSNGGAARELTTASGHGVAQWMS